MRGNKRYEQHGLCLSATIVNNGFITIVLGHDGTIHMQLLNKLLQRTAIIKTYDISELWLSIIELFLEIFWLKDGVRYEISERPWNRTFLLRLVISSDSSFSWALSSSSIRPRGTFMNLGIVMACIAVQKVRHTSFLHLCINLHRLSFE